MKTHGILVTLLATASLTALLWPGSAGADTPANYQPTALRKAEIALQHGHPDRALALLEGRQTEMRRWGAQAEANGLMCRAWFEKGEYSNAERACDAAVAASGGVDAEYVYHRGVMRLLLGRIDEGIVDLRRAGSMDASNSTIPADLTVANRF